MMTKNRKLTGIAMSVLVTASLLLSSCSVFGDNANEEIEKVVKDYFSEIEDNTYADNDFESDYASDTPFEDAEFADDLAKDAMLIGMSKFDYEIESTEGSTSKAEGTCKVKVTSLDVKKIVKSLEEDGLTYEAFEEAIKSKKAPTDESTITLKMEYNASKKEWKIKDSSDIFDVFGDPYTTLTFGPKAGDPTVMVQSFFTALSAADQAALEKTTEYYSYDYFYDGDETEMAISQAYYQSISYKVNGDVVVDEDTAEVPISVTCADVVAISEAVINDPVVVTELMKMIILDDINGTDSSDDYSTILSDAFKAAVADADAPMLTRDFTITLKTNEAQDAWLVYDIPSELFEYDLSTDPSEDLAMQCAVDALGQLLQEGKIDQATYDSLYSEITGETINDPGTDPSLTVGDNQYAKDLVLADWYDYSTNDYCTSYSSANTTMLELELQFATNWNGLEIFYDFYNVNGTVLIYSTSVVLGSSDYSAFLELTTTDGTNIPADTYLCRAYLADGSLIAESSVQVI